MGMAGAVLQRLRSAERNRRWIGLRHAQQHVLLSLADAATLQLSADQRQAPAECAERALLSAGRLLQQQRFDGSPAHPQSVDALPLGSALRGSILDRAGGDQRWHRRPDSEPEELGAAV